MRPRRTWTASFRRSTLSVTDTLVAVASSWVLELETVPGTVAMAPNTDQPLIRVVVCSPTITQLPSLLPASAAPDASSVRVRLYHNLNVFGARGDVRAADRSLNPVI